VLPFGWVARPGRLPTWAPQPARMTEVRPGRDRNAQDMPSWSASELQNEQADTPPSSADAGDIEAARRLLAALFAERPADERPPRPER
jgi:hypothetical protein